MQKPQLLTPHIVNNRIKIWSPKVRTGCATCKRRRLKCDEGKPSCHRCVKSHIVCEGYTSTPVAWVFRPETAADETKSAPKRQERSRKWKQDPEQDEEFFGNPKLRHNPGTPYCGAEQQRLFKFYMEKIAATVAKSELSMAFWVHTFPQAAWQFPAIRHILMSTSMAGECCYWRARGLPSRHTYAMAYDQANLAIRMLLTNSHSTECMLIASGAMWLNSMHQADWGSSLKHLHAAYKIIQSLPDLEKHDPDIVNYLRVMAISALKYYRDTRGPCHVHNTYDISPCETSCFEPEDVSSEVRIRDAMYHLTQAYQRTKKYKWLLDNKKPPHPHYNPLSQFLDGMDRQVSWLIKRWTSRGRFGYLFEDETNAWNQIPITKSPFTLSLDIVGNFIQENDTNLNILTEVVQRMRVVWANFLAATGIQEPRIREDAMTFFVGNSLKEQLEESKRTKTLLLV